MHSDFLKYRLNRVKLVPQRITIKITFIKCIQARWDLCIEQHTTDSFIVSKYTEWRHSIGRHGTARHDTTRHDTAWHGKSVYLLVVLSRAQRIRLLYTRLDNCRLVPSPSRSSRFVQNEGNAWSEGKRWREFAAGRKERAREREREGKM